ncbi:MAG TPA: hypothetical protein VKU61_05085 [Candidatus Binatia bacterium]|nr:hypothetical protein [Candidatus Binatia bacterium]
MLKERDDLEERGGSIFAPDTLLPSQYFDRVRQRTRAGDGERRLMAAVLEDAVRIYLKHAGGPGERNELFRETETWFEERGADRLYAFENVCAVLDLDADYLRRGLRARKPQAPRSAAVAEDAAVEGIDETVPFRAASGA